MILRKPSYEIEHFFIDPAFIEKIGRVCYKSEEKITPTSWRAFIKRIIESGHE